MSEPGQEKPLGGLARSIGALFSDGPGSAPATDEDPLGEPTGSPPATDEEPPASAPATDEVSLEEPPASTPLEVDEPPSADGWFLEEPAERGPRSDAEADHADEVARLLAEVERTVPATHDGAAPTPGVAGSSDLARRVVAALGSEKDESLRGALTAACVRLGRPAAEELSAALSDTQERAGRRAYLGALVAMGETAMPVVERMMEDDRWYVLRNGVQILGEVGDERAMAHVLGALARPEPKVRREALIAIAKIGGEDAGQLALGMLDDPDAAVRTAAARAVGDLGVERAHRRLVAMLGDEEDHDALIAVLHALGQLGDPGAVPAIERHAVGSFLRRPRTDVRISAYRALRQIGTPRARRLLNQAVDDRDPVVKQAVRQLLGMA